MKRFLLTLLACLPALLPAETLRLSERFQAAQPGDYLVTLCNKTYTLLLVRSIDGNRLLLEEVAAPQLKLRGKPPSWRQWISQGAPQHTSWVLYDIDLSTGNMQNCYSYTKRGYFRIPESENFLGTLLQVQFDQIPESMRKRTGGNGHLYNGLSLWQPPLIVEGQPVTNVPFDAWKTRWPQDGSALSGKTVEVYLPRDTANYPTYFPYWLQVTGTTGRAKIHIVDSGRNLTSPQVLP